MVETRTSKTSEPHSELCVFGQFVSTIIEHRRCSGTTKQPPNKTRRLTSAARQMKFAVMGS
ncbi:MAG: hypothetical protein ACRCUY_06275 [Thermoguttaceae bacterium]